MKKYIKKRKGQIDFFENSRIPWQDDDGILDENTDDSIWKVNIFEFKLNINNIKSVVFQAVYYKNKNKITILPYKNSIVSIMLGGVV